MNKLICKTFIRRWTLAGTIATLTALPAFVVVQIPEAHAVVGRPMTPGSVAGVARRTTRRHHHHRHVGAAVVTVIAIGTIVYSLPPKCSTLIVNNVSYYSCDGVYYQTKSEGTTQVYVVVDAPKKEEVTGMTIGSIITRLPSDCSKLSVDDVLYYSCDGVFYQPRYQGSTLVYVIVKSPY